MSCAPHLVQDADQDQHQRAPNKDDHFFAIVPHDREIVLDVWIAIEKLVSPAEDENAAKQEDDYGEGECDPERGNASLFNHRYHKESTRLHGKRIPTRSTAFYDASVGFSDATEGRRATTSSEVKELSLDRAAANE